MINLSLTRDSMKKDSICVGLTIQKASLKYGDKEDLTVTKMSFPNSKLWALSQTNREVAPYRRFTKNCH